MNKRGFTKTILIVLFLVLLFGLILYSSGITGKISFFSWLKSKTSEPKILKVQPQPPASDHIIVKFKKEISETQRNAIHAKTGGKVKDVIKQIDVQIVEIPKGKGITPEAFVETYKGNFKDELEYAEVDAAIYPALVPNDPLYYMQWQMVRIEAPAAWDVSTGSTGVTIAILDTGVDYNHPDFGGKVIKGWDFAQDDPDPTDGNSHGTAVAGVAAAVGNNGIGVVGMAWRNPILAVKVIGDGGMGWVSDSAQGIVYAADHGARVISMSYTGGGLQAEMDASAYAWSKGYVLVAAMGNGGTRFTWYPAGYANVLGVSATESSDTIASYSNYGPAVDVAAPGSADTTAVGGGYTFGGGTSIATPYVSGLAALLFSANPSLTNQQVVDIMQNTADDLGTPGWDEYFGWGRINAGRALQAVGQPTTGSIAGRVTDSSTGAAISGATVTALQSGIAKGQATTVSDGTYTISNLAQGTYDVKAEKINYQPQTQTGKTVTAGQTTTVNFALTPQPTTGNIAGRVTDANTGLAINGATVTALQSGVIKGQTTTSSDGTYTISNLPAGTYDVKAEKLNYQSQTQTGKTVNVGQTTTVNFALVPVPTTGNIAGRVTDANTGQGIAYATVSAYQSGTLIKSTTTLSDGTYTLSDLAAGSYDVTATQSGYQSQTKSASVTAGQTTTLDFALTPQPTQQYGSLTGTVTKSTGEIVIGGKVTVTNTQGASYSTTTNSAGVYTFTNIPVGTYNLKASFKGGWSASKSGIQIQAGQITIVNIILTKKGR